MLDEITSAAPVAESKPAEPQAAAETQTAPKPIESWTDAERSEWLKTGDTPKPKAGGESASPASSEAEQAESAPGSEPGKDTQQEQAAKGKQNAETRKRQLGGEIQTLLEQRRQLREENERLAAQRRGETRPEPPAGPQAAPGGAPRPQRPKVESFDTYEAYDAALDKYTEDLADWKTGQRIEGERQEFARRQQAESVKRTNDEILSSWQKRLTATKARHADFDEAVSLGDVPLNPIMDGYMLNSEIGPEMVYWFARNPADAERIAKLGPYQTAAELRDIERNLSEQLKAPATRTITGARPPETALPGKIVSPEDPVLSAVAARDFTSYMKAANARELKR